MQKKSTLHFLNKLLNNDHNNLHECFEKKYAKKTNIPSKKTIDYIVAYSKTVRGVKLDKDKKTLIYLN